MALRICPGAEGEEDGDSTDTDLPGQVRAGLSGGFRGGFST
jgi:hypothetical protein